MNARVWLMGVMALALVCSADLVRANVVCSDDFESYSGAATSWYSDSDNDPGGPWTIDESPEQTRVQVMHSPLSGSPVFDTPYGSQYLHIWRDAGGATNAWLALDSAAQSAIAANGTMRLVIDAYNLSGLDGWGGNIGISGWDSTPGAWTNRAFDVALRPDGKVAMYTGSGVQDDGINAAFDCNTWERLTIDANFVTDTWSLTIDSATKSGLAFEAGNLSKIQYILLSAWDFSGVPGRGGFDNLVVSSPIVPEPSTATLALSSLIGLLAYAWRKRK